MSTMEPKFSSKYGVNQKVIQVRVGLHGVESYLGDCMDFPHIRIQYLRIFIRPKAQNPEGL